ncbi:MAG TPA: M1 family metallopeptidase, partial [Microthrixaceae bacterium]|nr:M1 family metallopeptidase [Microthrixaceae bacterium]
GISSYMKKHAYGTTETTDLWESLEEVSGEPVRKMMDSWIFQGGHPSVRVEATDIGVRLTQSRFEYLSNGSDSQLDASSPSWLIPVTLRARALGSTEGLEVHYVLDDPAELDLGFRPEVVQVNVGANGFYRSELTPELRQALCADPTSDALERFMLIDDACAALHAGTVGYDEVWDLLTKMAPREMDPAVWRRIGSAARELNRLGGDANRAAVRRRVVDMSSNPLHDVTRLLTGRKSNDSDHDIERLEEVRGVLIVLRGALGADARTRGRAREIFNDDTQDISLMSAAIEVVAGSATPEEHQELERRWREASTPQEVLRYLTALVDTDLPELFDHALDLTLNEVRTQNAPYLLRRALSHDTLGSVAWEFIRDNWDAITEKFPSNSLPRMIEGIRSVTDRQLASSIQRFLDSTDLISGEQQIDQHIERMWVTVLVAERVRNSVT